jgi:competence protein ComEC
MFDAFQTWQYTIFLFCLLLIVNLLVWREYSLQPRGKFSVTFFDVGQGDSTLLVTPSGAQILIDGGPDMRVLEHLGRTLPFFDRSIDAVVVTHPDTDHIVALPEVLHRYKVQLVVLAGTEKQLGRYQSILDVVRKKSIPVLFSTPGTVIDFSDGVSLEAIWPNNTDVSAIKEPNNASVTLLATLDTVRILLTGDIEESAEKAILASGANVHASILKVPHHGSRTSSSTGFLLAVQPDLAILSSGTDNRYGHPHPEILNRYENLGIPVRNTALEGTISLEFR